MILPPSPRSIMWRPAARQRRKTLDRLTSITASQSASLCSAAGCAADDAGVVDEDVEAAERCDRRRRRGDPAASRSREIRGEQLPCGGRRSLRDRVRRWPPPAARWRAGRRRRRRRPAPRHRGAEPARRAGDERHLAVEAEQIERAGHRLATVSCGRSAGSPRESARRCRSARPPRRASSRRARMPDGKCSTSPAERCAPGPRSMNRTRPRSTMRDLLVRVRVHGGDDVRREAQPAHHQPLAPDHLALDALGDALDGNRGPVDVLKRRGSASWTLISSPRGLVEARSRWPRNRAAR